MKDEIKQILWDFARSVSKTTLNPQHTYAASIDKNDQQATKAANDVIEVIKKYEQSKNTAQMARN